MDTATLEVTPAESSSRFTVKNYVDIVEKQKHQFDAFFCLKLWRPKPNLHPEATKMIIEKILNSPQMKDTIHQVSKVISDVLNHSTKYIVMLILCLSVVSSRRTQ